MIQFTDLRGKTAFSNAFQGVEKDKAALHAEG